MSHEPQQSTTLLELMSGIVNAIPNGLITFSESGEVNLVNTSALKLLGLDNHAPADFLDTHYHNLLYHLPDLEDKIERCLLNGKHRELNLRSVLACGHQLHIHCYCMLKGVMVLIDKVDVEDALLYRNHNDMLTQLNNRPYFERQVCDMINQASNLPQQAALLFFDIDNFKNINDAFGHASGDEVLCRIATILKSRLSINQLIARMGGDQFVILRDNCTTYEAQSFAETIRKFIDTHTFIIHDQFIRVTVSGGVAPFHTQSAPEPSKLISIANTACQIAKDQGKNRTHVIDSHTNEFESYVQSIKWVDDINQAMACEHFVLYCQRIAPLMDTEAQDYYEVLLRLQNDQGEIISPNHFIPVAERYHMMPEIDRYVMSRLFKLMGSGPGCIYSVNLSGQTISDHNLVEFIHMMLNRYVFEPSRIVFEITETSAMSDFQGTVDVMNALRQLGFHFSLDDFGTGLSSFTYLKELPLDTVKIDGSFVREMDKDTISYQMVKSIHDIGTGMGLKTVAEFVESQAIYQCLSDIGVHFAQGYFIHKPQSIIDIHPVIKPKLASSH